MKIFKFNGATDDDLDRETQQCTRAIVSPTPIPTYQPTPVLLSALEVKVN